MHRALSTPHFAAGEGILTAKSAEFRVRARRTKPDAGGAHAAWRSGDAGAPPTKGGSTGEVRGVGGVPTMLSSCPTVDFDEYYLRLHSNEYEDPTHWWHPRHPVWVAYRHQIERTLLGAIERAGLPIEDVDLLEVGCGTGRHLRFFIEIGAAPDRIHGVDLLTASLRQAKRRTPSLVLLPSNAARQALCPTGVTGSVTQFALLFSSILDHRVREIAASEMRRVLEPGGWVLYYDVMKARPDHIPDGLDEVYAKGLFPDVEWLVVKRLHNRLLARLARHPLLAAAAELLPLPKGNVLMVGRKR